MKPVGARSVRQWKPEVILVYGDEVWEIGKSARFSREKAENCRLLLSLLSIFPPSGFFTFELQSQIAVQPGHRSRQLPSSPLPPPLITAPVTLAELNDLRVGRKPMAIKSWLRTSSVD